MTACSRYFHNCLTLAFTPLAKIEFISHPHTQKKHPTEVLWIFQDATWSSGYHSTTEQEAVATWPIRNIQLKLNWTDT
jgi:hypothetical protein